MQNTKKKKEVRKFRLSEETRVQNGVTLRRIEYLRTLVGADGETIVSAGTKAGEGVIIAMPS